MRLLICSAIVLCACKGSSSGPPASTRFLPGDPEVAFRIDVARVRGWSIYSQLAPIALSGVEMILKSANDRCGLDAMGTATTVIGAKKGLLMKGDITLIVSGLPRDKVTACLKTVAESKSILELQRDGDLFTATVQGRSIASGAILPSGELVVIARNGNGIELGAWKTEVQQGANAIPAWWSELEPYLAEPIAVRTSDGKRVVLATATFTDGLTLRGKIVTPSADDATRDTTALKAIVQYLETAKAAHGKIDTQGATIFAELTAKGPEVDALIKTGGPALFSRDAELPTEPEKPAAHHECSELDAAVATYMEQALGATPEPRRAEMAAMVTKMMPALKAAYVTSCTDGKWSDAAIECHVVNAANLPKFEKCRQRLTEEQRVPFDKAVGAVLSGAQQGGSTPSGGGSAGSAAKGGSTPSGGGSAGSAANGSAAPTKGAKIHDANGPK